MARVVKISGRAPSTSARQAVAFRLQKSRGIRRYENAATWTYARFNIEGRGPT